MLTRSRVLFLKPKLNRPKNSSKSQGKAKKTTGSRSITPDQEEASVEQMLAVKRMQNQVVELLSRRVRQWRFGNTQLDRPIPKRGIYRVIVCRPNHRLSNLELLVPLIAELQACRPGSQVDLVLGGEQGKELFRQCPNIGTIYSLPSYPLKSPWRFVRTICSLLSEPYDLAIDPDVNSRSSGLLAIRCSATHRIGFKGKGTSAGLSRALQVPLTVAHKSQLPVVLLRWALGEDANASNQPAVSPLDVQLTHNY